MRLFSHRERVLDPSARSRSIKNYLIRQAINTWSVASLVSSELISSWHSVSSISVRRTTVKVFQAASALLEPKSFVSRPSRTTGLIIMQHVRPVNFVTTSTTTNVTIPTFNRQAAMSLSNPLSEPARTKHRPNALSKSIS
jgi:hypothetical protein